MHRPITGEQIRAGRALVRIDQAELARRSGLSLETIKRLERIEGRIEAQVRTIHAVEAAFAELGVELICRSDGLIGVRLLSPTPALVAVT